MQPLLIAHRGNQTDFPENTMEAFQSAFDHGADGVELDVRFHQGNLIVVHDYYFDQSRSFPLLSDVLEKFSAKGRLEVEIKALNLDFLQPLQQLLNQYPNADIEITTSNFILLPALRETFAQRSLGIDFPVNYFAQWMKEDYIVQAVLGVMAITKADVAHVPVVFEELVKAVHDQGKKFHMHIPSQNLEKEVEQYTQAREWKVDQCTFNDIHLLDAVKIL